ncbi:single-stranded DNA-binding protein [Dactylosporangium sp. CA-139066]|uniref:single-stranded DNA-binding protein n=1 Tax=Dactylosporangium sp. CA-139066 TaxID=3239930 RepID=UPI003D8DA439
MSLPEIRGDGKLITEPRSGIAKTGTPWANCMVRFTGYRKDGDDWVEDSSFVAALAAFGDEAKQLTRYAKGDAVHIEGRLRSLRLWQPERGERPELEITVKSVTPPERRPRGNRGGQHQGQQGNDWPRPATSGAGSHGAEHHGQARTDPRRHQPHAATRTGVTTVQPEATPRQRDAGQRDAVVLAMPTNGVERLRRAHARNPYVQGNRTGGEPA